MAVRVSARLAGTGTPSGVLTAADLTPLGGFKIGPTDGSVAWNISPVFSWMPLAGRVVGGQIRLCMFDSTGNVNEYVDPGTYGTNPDLSDFPRASVNRAWPLVFNTHMVLNTGSAEGPVPRGLYFSPSGNLWCAYGPSYAGDRPSVPSLTAAVLHDDLSVDTYGPWRTTVIQQKSRGYMVTTPDGQIAVGAPITAGNGGSPWGLGLNKFTEPNITTLPPSDPDNPADVSIVTTSLVDYNIGAPQLRNDTNYIQTQWNTPYNPAGGCINFPGPNTFTTIDMMGAAVWVSGGAKTGVITFGQMVRTIPGFVYDGALNTQAHWWYGPSTDCYGQSDGLYGGSSGDTTATMQSTMWIYDPNNLGTSPTPIAIHAMAPFVEDVVGASAGGAVNLYIYGGAYYEPISKKLFVTYGNAEPVNCCGQHNPVIFVFQVNDL